MATDIFLILRVFRGLKSGIDQGIDKQHVFPFFLIFINGLFQKHNTFPGRTVGSLFRIGEFSQPYADKAVKTLFTRPRFSNLSLKKIQDLDFPGGAVVKNLTANAGDTGSSPGPGRSYMLWSN